MVKVAEIVAEMVMVILNGITFGNGITFAVMVITANSKAHSRSN
jgi:hypothetical protein